MNNKEINLRLDLEYDGAGFAGWAKQPGLASIEGTLEEVLGRILQERVSLTVAGRTDAGVHARGQVVNFRTTACIKPRRLQWSANQMLPDAICIRDISKAPDDFDARRSAISRIYSYTILYRSFPSAFRHRYVNFINGELDTDILRQAAALIAGEHDFTAFTPTVTEHSYFKREITLSEWRTDGDILTYWIGSKGFLRGMVRALVGTMLEIARGQRTLEDLAALLEGAERPEAGETAPPGGLCLEEVRY